MTRPIDAGAMGYEPWGDPYGLGGPLHVVRALAIGSNTVRLVFDEPPRARSPQATNDALNPANYVLQLVEGEGPQPTVVGVGSSLAQPGERAVYNPDERGVDIVADQSFVFGVVYRVIARDLVAAAGGALGSPAYVDFVGAAPPIAPAKETRIEGFPDFSQGATGAFTWAGGDIALANRPVSVRQRILRLLSTPLNSWAHLLGWGIDAGRLKEPASPAIIVPLKRQILTQVQNDPEVRAAKVGVSFSPATNILTVEVRAQTVSGEVRVEARAEESDRGFVITSS